MVVARRPGILPLAGLAATSGLSILAGSPQIAAIGLATMVALLAVAPGHRGPAVWARLATGLAFGAGLSAVQWLPSAELASFSARFRTTMSMWNEPLQPAWLSSLVIPPALNVPGSAQGGPWNLWEQNLYLGLPVVALALVALVARPTRRGAAPLLAVAAAALILAMGAADPVASAIPGLGFFRVPARFVLVTQITVAVAAGLGASAVAKRVEMARPAPVRWVRPMLVLAALAPLLASAFAPSWSASQRVHSLPDPLPGIFGASSPDHRVLVGSMNAWDKGMSLGFHNLGGCDPSLTGPMTAVLRASETGISAGPFRSMYARWPFPGRLRHSRILDVFAVAWILHADVVEPQGLERIAQVGPDVLWRNPHALPRALLSRCASRAGETDALKAMLDPAYDPAERVFVADRDSCRADTIPSGGARILEDTGSTLVVAVEASSDAWLFVSDLLLPGWTATVDDSPAELVAANVAGRALPVPAGRHHVRMEYAPRSFAVGALVSLASLMAAGVVALAAGTRRLRRASAPEP
jgi:hypothetical protein